MSRSSSDFSAKMTISPEVKSISSKRLYRGVLDCICKLEQGHQHRRNLISLFQSEQVKLRHRLRESCERLLFTYPKEYGKKAEELLWRKVYYDVIHAVKNGRKFQSNAPGALQQRHLVPHYQQFLYAAIGYYQYLLLRLQSKVRHGLVAIDCPLAPKPLAGRHNLAKKDSEEIEEWVMSTSYRLLVCLGDLSRYQMEFGGSTTRAKRFYQLALRAYPSAGMPHNQIATLAGHHTWWGLTAAYYYCCSLQAEHSFDGADGNLQRLLDRNKKLFYQLPTDALEDVINSGTYKKDHTRIFVVSFLYLCDLLRPKTYATDVEITGLCKRLVDALPVCLSHIRPTVEEAATPTIDDVVKENVEDRSGEKAAPSHPRHLDSTKRNPKKTAAGSAAGATGSAGGGSKSNIESQRVKQTSSQQQTRLNEETVFQICVLCLVNVHDLQSCRSNRSSAAIAFALAFFSHLLSHLVSLANTEDDGEQPTDAKRKQEQDVTSSAKKDVVTQNGDDILADGDGKQAAGKKKTRRRRTRRRRLDHSPLHEDHSEGEEEEELGAGDNGAESESESGGSEDEEGDGFSCASDSSESRSDQLSQEELSSHEEVQNGGADSTSVGGGGDEVADPPPPAPESIAIDSLQDLSKKMFQPSPRRPITLAPSFLQHLASPPVSKSPKSEPKDDDVSGDDVTAIGTNDVTAKRRLPCNDVDQDATRAAEAFRRLERLSRHHHLTASVKLLSDWLAANERIVVACSRSSRALWCRLVSLVNLLPNEHQLLERAQSEGGRVEKSVVEQVSCLVEQVNGIATPPAATDEKTPEATAAPPDPPPAPDTDTPPSTKQPAIEASPCKPAEGGTASWKQTCPLPEDYLLFRMNMVRDANQLSALHLTGKKPAPDLSDFAQCAVRASRLRAFCHQLAAVSDVQVEPTPGGGFTAPDDATVDPQQELEAVEAMRKTKLMKDMAASRLRMEVAVLESSLGSPQTRDSAMCLYLVPDVLALCYDLPALRRLASCGRFFVVIPNTVIDGLDELKKELQGARDATRYLETELKKGNRFVRAQGRDELVRGVEGEPPKLRRHDIYVWRFYRVIECCRYLVKREAQSGEVSDHHGLVTILTRHGGGSQQNGTISAAQEKATEAAKRYGMQVSTATLFDKSWSAQQQQQP